MKRLLSLLNVVGFAIMLFATTMLVPLSVAAHQDDPAFNAFLQSIMVALLAGALLFLLSRGKQRELQARDGFLLVTLVWTILPLIGSLPLLLYFAEAGRPISFAYAYFEAMSGLTTTGATVLPTLNTIPDSIHVWRATIMWIGGMGILVLAVAILPLLGVGGSQVVRAETPGPMKDEKLTPRIASTAKGLYAVYLGISLSCWAAYVLAGMDFTDAYVHMAATVSLGGFSSYDSSFGAFNSVALESIAVFFMLICAVSFATHFNALRLRSATAYWHCPEARYVLAILLSSSVIVSAYLWLTNTYTSALEALRYGIFNTVSVATTTGFANTDYLQWPIFAPLLIILLSCFTSSSGSTGSGIKLIRLVLICKQTRVDLRRVLHPRLVAPVQISQRVVDARVLLGLMAFLMLYVASIIVIGLLLVLTGLDPATAFSASLASINNLGPGLGGIGPASSFAVLDNLQIWLCTFGMLLGRLELVTVLVLLTPSFWRN